MSVERVGNYIREHPYRTAIGVLSGLLLTACSSGSSDASSSTKTPETPPTPAITSTVHEGSTVIEYRADGSRLVSRPADTDRQIPPDDQGNLHAYSSYIPTILEFCVDGVEYSATYGYNLGYNSAVGPSLAKDSSPTAQKICADGVITPSDFRAPVTTSSTKTN